MPSATGGMKGRRSPTSCCRSPIRTMPCRSIISSGCCAMPRGMRSSSIPASMPPQGDQDDQTGADRRQPDPLRCARAAFRRKSLTTCIGRRPAHDPSDLLRQRRILGEEGLVIVTMLRDAVSGEIINGPEILSRGFVFEQQLSHILDEARELVIEYTENIPPDEVDKLNDGVRSMLRRFFRASLGRDPVVLSLITVL